MIQLELRSVRSCRQRSPTRSHRSKVMLGGNSIIDTSSRGGSSFAGFSLSFPLLFLPPFFFVFSIFSGGELKFGTWTLDFLLNKPEEGGAFC